MLRHLITRFSPTHNKQPFGSDASFVPTRDAQGHTVGMMDRLTESYLKSTAPDPSQATLDVVLGQVNRVRIIDGGTIDGKAIGFTVLLDTSDPSSVAAFRACLAIVEDPRTFGHCMCFGDTAIEFYHEQELIATLGLHHGHLIRWNAWKHDAQLRDGQALLNWLAEHGVTGPLVAYQAQQRQAEDAQQAAKRWYDAMPACLQPYWPQMHTFAVDLEPLQQALDAAYADRAACARALFAWFGSGLGPWSGCPMYEQVAEKLLLGFPTAALVDSLIQQPLTPAQLEGAARYFAGWLFSQHKPHELAQVPVELQQSLLAHSLTSTDDDKVQRALAAFAQDTS